MPEPTWTDYVQLRRSISPAAPPFDDAVRYYSDEDGALRLLLSDGTDEPVAGAGNLPNPTEEGDVLTVVDGEWAGAEGGGGSQPTDTVVEITHAETDLPLLPIIGVDVEEGTLTVAGDYATFYNQLNQYLTVEVGFITVVGSTGNDGPQSPSGAVFADGSTAFTGCAIFDPTVDGSIQLPNFYLTTIDLPENSAVEWVFLNTDEAWDAEQIYWAFGDSDNLGTFMIPNDSPIGGNAGLWEWPRATLDNTTEQPIHEMVGSAAFLRQYPEGTTVSIAVVEAAGGSTGHATVIVHHHFTEPLTAERVTP